MGKPEIAIEEDCYTIRYVLEGESKIQIVNLEGGKSYQTIKFPAGTDLTLRLSKNPIEEIKK